MKATEEFNQDFRPKARSKHEEEDPDASFFPYYDDPRINIRKICIKYGLPVSFLITA